MPSSVSKVTKSLRKKNKELSTLHAESRSAKRLRRAVGRDAKVLKHAALREVANERYLERVRYFQNAVVGEDDAGSSGMTEKQLHELARDCVTLHEPELTDLKAARRPGRPSTAREDWLTARLDSERKEWAVGYWVPDVRDADNVDRLRNWDGAWSMLSPIAFVRVSSDGTVRDSRWPPNGMS